jgi:tellurite methyltransferase
MRISVQHSPPRGDNKLVPRDWNRHYSAQTQPDLVPEPLLIEVADSLPPGRALDLACGTGRNAIHLARLGWHVTAVDRSPAAIEILRDHAAGLAIDAHLADLETSAFHIPADSYDLVCDILYLQRSLFPAIRASLHPGGLFVGVVLLGEGEFRAQPEELRRQFADWRILYYSESRAGESTRTTVSIIARKA